MQRPLLALAAVMLGCAIPAAGALAQFYPPYGYRAAPPPPVELDDDEDEALPGQPDADPRAVQPYRSAPQGYEPRGRRFAAPYRDAEPYGLRPPGDVGIEPPRGYGAAPPDPNYPSYPNRAPRPGYGSQQGYGPPQEHGAQPGYGTQPGYGAQPGYGGQQQGYGPQPGYVAPPAPTGRGDGRHAALPPEYQAEEGSPGELPPQFRRQLVDYRTREPAGTLIIDTPNTYLYLVLGNGKAMRYGIGVGREGFTWAGEERISRMSEWPDWHPPADMIERQPYLPRFMAGGPGNPLGARALYLGKSLYRIHGTNQPSTIGGFVSSGCIRLVNEDIEDLYGRVNVGTRVVVLTGGDRRPAASAAR